MVCLRCVFMNIACTYIIGINVMNVKMNDTHYIPHWFYYYVLYSYKSLGNVFEYNYILIVYYTTLLITTR